MNLVEKIILYVIDYLLMGVFSVGATLAYLTVHDRLSMIFVGIIFILAYVLTLIEEL